MAGRRPTPGIQTLHETRSHQVFISYAHEDSEAAGAVCAAIEAQGLRCWIAPRDVSPGSEWSEAIVEAISRCRVMVVLLTRHSNASPDVRREVQHAFHTDTTVIPFRTEPIEPNPGLSYYLAPLHWLDAFNQPLDSSLRSLTGRIQSAVGAIPLPTPPTPPRAAAPPAPPPAAAKPPTTPIWNRGMLLTLILVSIGIGLLASLMLPRSGDDSRVNVLRLEADRLRGDSLAMAEGLDSMQAGLDGYLHAAAAGDWTDHEAAWKLAARTAGALMILRHRGEGLSRLKSGGYLDPTDVGRPIDEYANRIGNTLYEAGEFTRAQLAYLNALKRAPNNPVILTNLAWAFHGAANDSMARRAAEAAIHSGCAEIEGCSADSLLRIINSPDGP